MTLTESLVRYTSVLLLLGPLTASATPILDEQGGQLAGASGVEVNGLLYDVTFVDGSCVDVFDGCDDVADFAFMTFADARAASEALLDTVLVDSPLGNFDSSPELTPGCSFSRLCWTFTPYAISLAANSVSVVRAENTDQTDSVLPGAVSTPRTFDQSNFVIATWAVWSRQAVSVTEPSSAALAGLGLLGMGFARRRIRDAQA